MDRHISSMVFNTSHWDDVFPFIPFLSKLKSDLNLQNEEKDKFKKLDAEQMLGKPKAWE